MTPEHVSNALAPTGAAEPTPSGAALVTDGADDGEIERELSEMESDAATLQREG